MLGSITPLGERGRGSRWWLTVTAYLVGSTLGGVAFGGGLGLAGSSFASRTPVAARLAVLAVAVLAGLLVDLGAFGLRLPTVRRQVDEGWRAGYGVRAAPVLSVAGVRRPDQLLYVDGILARWAARARRATYAAGVVLAGVALLGAARW